MLDLDVTNGSCINTESSEVAVAEQDLYHYVVVRRDLSTGQQLAQTAHAAGESASPKPDPGCVACALHARDEVHLRLIERRLVDAGIAHACVVEGDGQHAGQLMAIGVCPTRDRPRIRSVLSDVPSAK